MTRKEDAENYFADGFTCSQAVFAVFGRDFSLIHRRLVLNTIFHKKRALLENKINYSLTMH